MKIVGITGTNGAGKGTVAEYLVRNEGFVHYSARELIIEELSKRHLAFNKDNMITVANELRRVHGPSYIAQELYNRAYRKGKNSIIESIRTTGEIDLLRSYKSFILLAVDAKPYTRYLRIKKRGSSTDKISYSKFQELEEIEKKSTSQYEQNLTKCISLADVVIDNNGTMENLEKVLDNLFI